MLTGATGFLGSNLFKELYKLNYNIIVLKRSFSDEFRLGPRLPDVKYYDIDKIDLEEAFKSNQIDCIIHCATDYGRKNFNILKILDANLIFPLKLLLLGIEYNVGTFVNTDTVLDKRVNGYSLSKSQFLDWLKFSRDKIKVINIALEHFYGAFDDVSKFTSYIFQSMINNKDEILLTKGEQKRDFIYISDVVEAFLTILENTCNLADNFNSFEVGSGKSVSIREFCLLVKSIANNNSTKLQFGAIPYRDNEVMDSKADISRLVELNWIPKIDLREGILLAIKNEKKQQN